MRILFFDCFAGICGDMFLAAMIDLGLEKDYLVKELKKVKLPEKWKITSRNVSRNGLRANMIDIDGTSSHHHRTFKDITALIKESSLHQKVKKLAISMFTTLAQAEAHVHHQDIDKVHFHEIGAVDSILDITGAAIAINYFDPDKIYSSPLNLGSGTIQCAHGVLPVPAPATAEIIKGIPTYQSDERTELTTPTGATIIKNNVDDFVPFPQMEIERIGHGAGRKKLEIPNILRIFQGKYSKEATESSDDVIEIETNIDDQSPQWFEVLFEKLFENGALDVFLTPIIMKKGRPGQKLSVLCSPNQKDIIIQTLFRHSTTLGVRFIMKNRKILKRTFETIQTKYGKVRIKKGISGKEILVRTPEYEDCKKIAKQQGISLKELYLEIGKHI